MIDRLSKSLFLRGLDTLRGGTFQLTAGAIKCRLRQALAAEQGFTRRLRGLIDELVGLFAGGCQVHEILGLG